MGWSHGWFRRRGGGGGRKVVVARNEPKYTEETRLEKRSDEWYQFSRLAPPIFTPSVSELTVL
jgi:hypothetical protein